MVVMKATSYWCRRTRWRLSWNRNLHRGGPNGEVLTVFPRWDGLYDYCVSPGRGRPGSRRAGIMGTAKGKLAVSPPAPSPACRNP
jgi:hypothetical protein